MWRAAGRRGARQRRRGAAAEVRRAAVDARQAAPSLRRCGLEPWGRRRPLVGTAAHRGAHEEQPSARRGLRRSMTPSGPGPEERLGCRGERARSPPASRHPCPSAEEGATGAAARRAPPAVVGVRGGSEARGAPTTRVVVVDARRGPAAHGDPRPRSVLAVHHGRVPRAPPQ